MKNSAPNEESQPSTEQLEEMQRTSQENSSPTTDDGGVDLVDVLEVAVDFISGIFED